MAWAFICEKCGPVPQTPNGRQLVDASISYGTRVIFRCKECGNPVEMVDTKAAPWGILIDDYYIATEDVDAFMLNPADFIPQEKLDEWAELAKRTGID